VNRFDRPDADYDVTPEALREHYGPPVPPSRIPMGTGDALLAASSTWCT
jgi:elongation factor G